MHKDAQGNPIEIGDRVACTPTGYQSSELLIGTVVSTSPKMVKIKYDSKGPLPWHKDGIHRDPQQVIVLGKAPPVKTFANETWLKEDVERINKILDIENEDDRRDALFEGFSPYYIQQLLERIRYYVTQAETLETAPAA